MMIQMLSFDVESRQAKEINIKNFNASNYHIIACLLVGSPCSQAVCEFLVWFDITDKAVDLLWFKGKKRWGGGVNGIEAALMDDKNALHLMLDILRHRYQTVIWTIKKRTTNNTILKHWIIKSYIFDQLFPVWSDFGSFLSGQQVKVEKTSTRLLLFLIVTNNMLPDNDSSKGKRKWKTLSFINALWGLFILGSISEPERFWISF